MEKSSKPVPDPTELTTEALRRDLGALSALLDTKIKRNELRIGYEAQIASLKFDGVQRQFDMLAAHKKEIADLNQKALDAALTTAKESVAKSEAGTKEQISGMMSTFVATTNGLRDSIYDVKTRLDKGEGSSTGKKDLWGWAVGVIGICGALVAIFAKR